MKPFRYRLWACLLFALLLTAVFGVPVPAGAERTCGENLTWRLEGKRLIISGTGRMDNFIEPYEPAAGTLSHAPWNEYSDQIREVVIEDGVTSVGNYAFSYLGGITSVSLPDSLVSIGKWAFTGCSITEIRIPDSVMEIKESAFALCEELESITLSNILQEIEFGTFQSCTNLKNVTLPASVKIIGDDAFLNCESLEEIDLSSVSHIDGLAVFVNCTSLKNIIVTKDSAVEQYCVQNHLPYTAGERPEAASANEDICGHGLTWKLENETLTISGSGAMADFRENEGVQKPYLWYTVPGTTAPWDGLKFRSLVIEEGVTSIGDYAFNCHTELVDVSLPDTLKSIGDYAFCYCENMADFVFPDGIEVIGTSAFGDCRGLKNIILPEALTEIKFGAFQCCNAVEKVILQDNVKIITESAFYGCFGMKEINLPASLTRIDDGALASCDSLKQVVVDKDSYAEKFCISAGLPYTYAQEPVIFGNEGRDSLGWKLENGTLTISGTGKMDDYMRMMGGSQQTSAPWDGQKITQVVVEPGVTSIGAFAFWGCSQLKTVVLPDTVTAIGKFAFENCALLREITLPEGVTVIGKKAFSQCSSLKTITLPASVGSIGDDAFDGCGKLKVIVVNPGSYAEQYCAAYNLPYNYGDAVPAGTPVPVQITVEKVRNTCGPDLVWILEEDGTLRIIGTGVMDDYEQVGEDQTQSGAAPWDGSKVTRVVIEDGVTSIGAFAFEGCAMTEISLPDTLKSVEYGAFDNCTELKTVTLPDSVKTIGMLAFNECTGLTEIRLPASLTSIGAAAFRTCIKLTEITLPDAVREVGMYAFHNCIALKTVTLPASLETLGEYAFDGCQALRAVIVPKDSYAEKYCVRKGIAYVYTGSSPEAIPTEAPYGICGRNLTWKLDNDGTLTVSGFGKMDDYERQYSDRDESGSAGTINNAAPWSGRDVRKVVIGQGVTRIGSAAFFACDTIESVELPDTLEAIGSFAFAFTALKEIVIPDSVTSIGENVFAGCESLTGVRLPVGLKIIPASAFSGCLLLKQLILPASLQRIEALAFSECTSLKELTIPESVIMIGSSAFENGLENCVVVQGSYAEKYCREKKVPYSYPDGTRPELSADGKAGTCGEDLTWKLDKETLVISGTGKMFDYDEYIENNYIIGSTAPWNDLRFDTVIVEEGVTSIGDYAFALQYGVKRFTLPETLTSIGTEAFWGSRITWIDIPDAVTNIGSNAFSYCPELMRLKLPSSLKRIEYGVFNGCDNLQEITIPEGVKSISDYAFSDCSNLKEVRMPASVVSIGNSVFEGCPDLKVILAEKGGRAEKYCYRNGIAYSYAENE